MKRSILITLLALLVTGGAFWMYNADPERRLGCFRNESARCVGCGYFINSAMEQFMMEKKTRWLPRGGKTPADSLCQLLEFLKDTHNFTSHRLAPDLQAYFQKHGTMTYGFMCYRYNEGLSVDDPKDLIVMYYRQPTYWENNQKKRDFLGRPVLTLDLSPSWTFLPENEFQKRQAETMEYIRRRNLRPNDLSVIQRALVLAVHSRSEGTNMFRLTATLMNKGQEPISVQFLDSGSLEGEALLDWFKDKPVLSLPPGGDFSFPGWREVAETDTLANGRMGQK